MPPTTTWLIPMIQNITNCVCQASKHKVVSSRHKGGWYPGCKGLGTQITKWWFCNRMGGIMEVAMWLCASLLVGLWSSLGLVPIYVVWVLGNEGWGGGSSTYVGLSYTWLRNWFKDANGFDFEYSSNIQLRPKKTFLSLYLCLVQRLVWIYISHINHVTVCMCNSSKYWFKHPLLCLTWNLMPAFYGLIKVSGHNSIIYF